MKLKLVVVCLVVVVQQWDCPCIAEEPPTYEHFMQVLLEEVQECRQDQDEFRVELGTVYQQQRELGRKVDGGISALSQNIAREAKAAVLAARNDDKVCLSVLLEEYARRLNLIEDAISSNRRHIVRKPTPAVRSLTPAERPPAKVRLMPKVASASPARTSEYPFDEMSENPLALCSSATLIARCVNFASYHGNIYRNCDGTRVLLRHPYNAVAHATEFVPTPAITRHYVPVE